MRSFITCTLQRILFVDQIKEDMGGACSMDGRDKKCIQYCLENLKRRNHLKELGVDGRIILE
jgi:hypothetical protein